MGRVLDNVNTTLNAYYRMNSQVGNEKQTSLKQIKAIMDERWNDLCNVWLPKFAEECPPSKCYKEEFESFYDVKISKKEDVSTVYIESQPEIETLDLGATQKRL